MLKNDLIETIHENLDIPKSVLRKYKKQQLVDISQGNMFPDINVDKVCTARKSSSYPNRYKKTELLSLAYNEGHSKKDVINFTIPELCDLLNIPFINIPAKPKKSVRKSSKRKSIRKSSKRKSIRKSFSKSDRSCIARSKLPLKQHQKIAVEFIKNHRGLVAVHDVGSGKTLTAVTISQCYLDANPNNSVIVVTPTSLQENFKKEMIAYGASLTDNYKFYTITGFYNASAKGKVNCKKSLLIIDEAHNLRTEVNVADDYDITKKKKPVVQDRYDDDEEKKKKPKETGLHSLALLNCAKKADKVLLLTATPMVNGPKDLINLINMVNGKTDRMSNIKQILSDPSSRDFRDTFGCRFSFFKPDDSSRKNDYPKARYYDEFITMDFNYYRKYLDIEGNFDSTNLFGGKNQELNLKAFYNGVRRASNAIEKEQSPKVNWILDMVEKHKKSKFVVFSHFLESGLNLLMKRLDKLKVSYKYISGSLSIQRRKEAVDAYNSDKVRVLLISKAGGEGLDLKGTRYVILMEPSWNDTTQRQVIGRGVRFRSHSHLPEDKRVVDIYKLYMIKPEETINLKTYLAQKTVKLDTGDKLSVDLFLKNHAERKEFEINDVLANLKSVSIENMRC